MNAETLKTACLGLSAQAQDILAQAGESEFFNIVAVADSDAVEAVLSSALRNLPARVFQPAAV